VAAIKGRSSTKTDLAIANHNHRLNETRRTVYDRARVRLPRGGPAFGDTAYKETALRTPHRKPRGGELTARQRAGNRRLGRKRIAVEHGIGKRKVWRIAGERWRQPRWRHTLVMKNVAGLHNRMFGE
jgi:hypothetical protein